MLLFGFPYKGTKHDESITFIYLRIRLYGTP